MPTWASKKTTPACGMGSAIPEECEGEVRKR